jgi:hypothetical protein
MIPSRPHTSSTGSELEVFELLRCVDFGVGAVGFASLHLSEHEYKKWGEIDFVVLSSKGLLVLEIKGGQVSCDARGIWRYESRGQKTIERFESPIAQASSAYFSVRDRYLIPRLGAATIGKAPSGFGAILARTEMRHADHLIGGTEMPRSLVGTSEDVRDQHALTEFLRRVLEHWCSHPPFPQREWEPKEVEEIGRTLRPYFDRVPPLSLSSARIRQEQLALTEEQYQILDFSDRAPRLLCTGGAGCGKTLLALECLRRELPNNPVLITGTESLAAHLRVSAVEFSERIMSFGEATVASANGQSMFGSLIVDEGQQITNAQSFSVLSTLLRGGLSGGRWRWFGDPNNQLLKLSRFEPDCQSRLEGLAFPGSLSRNCRNTPQIVSTIDALTGIGLNADRMVGKGPDVLFAIGDTEQARMDSAASMIRSWLRDPEIPVGEIVLLSPRSIEHTSAWEIASRAKIPIRRWQPGWDRSPSYPREMAAATIEEFRGLEAPYVVLCDMDGAVDDLKRHFYLGLSRANVAAIVVADREPVARLALSVASEQRVSRVEAQ